MATACGGSGDSTSIDAAQSDAAHDVADAAMPDAPWTVGTIKVTARDGGRNPYTPGLYLSVGTSVVFSDATQTTQVVQTDTNGVAVATVTGPTTVTHVQSWGSYGDEAITVEGAMPGDDILLERENHVGITDTSPVSVSFTPAASTTYEACTACACASGTTSPLSVQMRADCQTNPAPVVLFATSSSTKTYGFGSAAYDAGTGGSITLTPTLSFDVYTTTLSNIPAAVSSVAAYFSSGRPKTSMSKAAPSANEMFQLDGWQGFPSKLSAYFSRSDGALQSVSEVVTGPAVLSVDASQLLPWLGTPSFDLSTLTFHAVGLPGGDPGDLFVGTFYYAKNSGNAMYWTVFAAHPGLFSLPTIPTTIVDTSPVAGTFVSCTAFVFADDATAGYDDARHDPFGMWRRNFYGTDGRTRYSSSPYANPVSSP